MYMYFWILDMYVYMCKYSPVSLDLQAELGACYFVSLALYSYFCYLMFNNYGFLRT
ncbi:uncharacterized protein DS421_10g305960 [Arachis hypogaea]|nr:uncharacterized protein DS421_10g305960 [Arachis hypogaea]